MTRAVLIGNYGVGNFGDEALREYFVRRFSDVHWTVVSANPSPDEVPRLPLGIRSFFSPWWKTVRAIRQSDVVIFGGGTLFTDIESLMACAIWGIHALACVSLRCPYVLAAQGIGPFKTRIGEGIARFVLRHAHAVSIRDEASTARVRSLSPDTKSVQVFDPAFSLLVSEKTDVRSKNVLIVIPRQNSGKPLFNAVSDELTNANYDSVDILSFEPDTPSEQKICQDIVSAIRLPATVHPVRTPADAVTLLRPAQKILTERYHGGLLAIALGKPFRAVSQAPGDKLSTLEDERRPPEVVRERVAALESQLSEILGAK